MSLATGTRLGHYEILSSLGAGGMGEVYRAKDTKLGREVAIKLLLEEVSSDPERLARFEREARVLASLNHNNIARQPYLEWTRRPARPEDRSPDARSGGLRRLQRSCMRGVSRRPGPLEHLSARPEPLQLCTAR